MTNVNALNTDQTLADGARICGVWVPAVISRYQSTAEVARCLGSGIDRRPRREAWWTMAVTPWTAVSVIMGHPRTVDGQGRALQRPAVCLAVRLTTL